MKDDAMIKDLLHQAEVARIMGDIPNARLFYQAAERIKELNTICRASNRLVKG